MDGGLITSDMSSYCMSIKELTDDDSLAPKYGVVFVDTSTAEYVIFVQSFEAQFLIDLVKF